MAETKRQVLLDMVGLYGDDSYLTKSEWLDRWDAAEADPEPEWTDEDRRRYQARLADPGFHGVVARFYGAYLLRGLREGQQ